MVLFSFGFGFFGCPPAQYVGCRILVSQPGIESPAVEAQSPIHWTTREFPHMAFIDDICSPIFIFHPNSCYYHSFRELTFLKHLCVRSICIYCFGLFDIFMPQFLFLQLCWSSSALHFPPACLHSDPNHLKTPELHLHTLLLNNRLAVFYLYPHMFHFPITTEPTFDSHQNLSIKIFFIQSVIIAQFPI